MLVDCKTSIFTLKKLNFQLNYNYVKSKSPLVGVQVFDVSLIFYE